VFQAELYRKEELTKKHRTARKKVGGRAVVVEERSSRQTAHKSRENGNTQAKQPAAATGLKKKRPTKKLGAKAA